jgi:carbamoyltransferase
LSHASSAFFPSPFKDGAVLTIDGVGEWATAGIFRGSGNHLEICQELKFPHSLGLLYSAFTAYCGFAVNDGEYKLMGLAPYGEPRFSAEIKQKLIDIKDDGSFRLDMRFFNYTRGLTMFNKKFEQFFGREAREAGSPLDQHFMDVAASIQAVTEEVVEKMAVHAQAITGMRHLCLAGGVALNCVANGKLLTKRIFDDIWIQPAAGDAGGAVGAALAISHMMLGEPRHLEGVSVPHLGTDGMSGSLLGPSYSEEEIRLELDLEQAKYELLSESELVSRAVEELQEGRALGWFQGRMEFGPRALGNRSILADARSPEMQRRLNLKTKFRESFRPFAPIVLREHVQKWFDLDTDSPYMLLVAQVSKLQKLQLTPDAAGRQGFSKLDVERSTIPAVTHVDGSARVQTVDRGRNPLLHRLLSGFYEATGCPVLVNTSFNVNNEPIVCSPRDAYRCFSRAQIDVLILGNYFLVKSEK